MTRTTSPNKRKAQAALDDAARDRFTLAERRIAVQAGIAYALLEVAYQVGRVADNVPIWGPTEER